MSIAQKVKSNHLSIDSVARSHAKFRLSNATSDLVSAVRRDELNPLDAAAVNSIRGLVMDYCDQHGGAHGGSAIGMAAIGVALWKYTMRYDPLDDQWIDRDRFVLSNGHTSIFLYIMLHLSGYPNMTHEQLMGYTHPTASNFTTQCHVHPEIEVPGIEITTGPLGQGISNAVGMAIASKNLAATYNRESYEIVSGRIYCMTGDACLHEGTALESIALAGHLALDNLVLIYDNNGVTNDAPLVYCDSDDVNAKMRASGWQTLDVPDGNYDVKAIVSALEYARSLKGKPVFINVRTIIGLGSKNAGTAAAHHALFGADDVASMKAEMGLDPHKMFHITEDVKEYFNESATRGKKQHSAWNNLVTLYCEKFLDPGASFISRSKGNLDTEAVLKFFTEYQIDDQGPQPTRASAGALFTQAFERIDCLIGGSADLVGPNKLQGAESQGFQNPENKNVDGSYAGRFVRFGIREHGMTSIANGIAAFQIGAFIPFTSSFFMFYSYAAAGVRMGALCGLKVIHIATHDSIGEGDNGPTHQPIELDSLFRAMPNLKFIRPTDAEEVVGAWQCALLSSGSTMISLSRQSVPQLKNTSRKLVSKGAYVVKEIDEAKLTIISTGSELQTAIAAAEELDKFGIATRAVSMPCMELFNQQPHEYQRKVLPRNKWPIVSLEPYIPLLWAKYATASIGVKSWGYSCASEHIYTHYGLDTKSVVSKLKQYLNDLQGEDARIHGWMEL